MIRRFVSNQHSLGVMTLRNHHKKIKSIDEITSAAFQDSFTESCTLRTIP
ncbi:hypothetical protein FRC0485_01020 [Corynebacterium diphtheriae]|nr:hypothetical protein FRC0485_01020 [Corynebacterium diphtheriae]